MSTGSAGQTGFQATEFRGNKEVKGLAAGIFIKADAHIYNTSAYGHTIDVAAHGHRYLIVAHPKQGICGV